MFITSWQLAAHDLRRASNHPANGPVRSPGAAAFAPGQDALAEASARASESLRAIDTVQAFTREPEERLRFREAVENTFHVALRRIRVRSTLTASLFSFVLAGLIGVLWYGAIRCRRGPSPRGP